VREPRGRACALMRSRHAYLLDFAGVERQFRHYAATQRRRHALLMLLFDDAADLPFSARRHAAMRAWYAQRPDKPRRYYHTHCLPQDHPPEVLQALAGNRPCPGEQLRSA